MQAAQELHLSLMSRCIPLAGMQKFVTRAAIALSALILIPATALAQTASNSSISVTSTPSTTQYAPGTTGSMLGTFTLAPANGVSSVTVSSIPLTLMTTGGAVQGNLSNCQLSNSNGSALTSGQNTVNTVFAGQNTFTFDQPLVVSSGVPMTLSIRCNISSNAPVGSGFSFIAGPPIVSSVVSGTTMTPTPSGTNFGVTLISFPSVNQGEIAAPIAAVTFSPAAAGTNVSVGSIPFSATYGGGLDPSQVSNCRLRMLGTSLTSSYGGALSAGTNYIPFDSSFVLAGGSSAMPVMLTCDIASTAPVGGTLGLSLIPSQIVATNSSLNSSITAVPSVNSSGATNAISGVTSVVAPAGSIVGGPTGAPNTGAGSSAGMNLLMLAVALGIVGAGAYLARTRRAE